MAKYSLVRTIYLYLFAILGLVLMTIGSVRFLDMALKAFVFTQAEEEERAMYKEPFYAPMPVDRLEKASIGTATLSVEEKANLTQWLGEYKNWKETRSKVDLVVARRHRNASLNLAMMLIGLPLYLFHWRVIQKETKNGSQSA